MPLIKELLDYNGDGRRFGDLSHWLHNKCTDVPVPRRAKIKEFLQRIITFTVELSNEYKIDKPGEKSQILRKLDSNKV